MAQFTDKQGDVWEIQILPNLHAEVKKSHGIDLLDFQRVDPREKMLLNPMVLFEVIEILCSEQIEETKLDRKAFFKLMPSPPDSLMAAITDAIIETHHSSEADKIREMFLRYDELSAVARKQTLENIRKVVDDPRTAKAIRKVVNDRFEEAMQQIEKGA